MKDWELEFSDPQSIYDELEKQRKLNNQDYQLEYTKNLLKNKAEAEKFSLDVFFKFIYKDEPETIYYWQGKGSTIVSWIDVDGTPRGVNKTFEKASKHLKDKSWIKV
jgi:hypothetical protein